LIISRGTIDISHVTFAKNFATFQGGAVFASTQASVTLIGSIFSDNRLDPTHTNPVTTEYQGYHTASSRDIFGCSKNRQNRIVENSTYPLDDFGFR